MENLNLDRILAVRTGVTVYRAGSDCLKLFGRGARLSEVLTEAANQALARELGAKVPEIREVTVLDGRPVLVSEFIRGKTLAQLLAESPERSDEIIKRLADAVKSLARIKIPDGTLEATPAHLKGDRLVHGELTLENVLASEDGDFILDWASASRGSEYADAALTALSLDGEARAKFLAHFGEDVAELARKLENTR